MHGAHGHMRMDLWHVPHDDGKVEEAAHPMGDKEQQHKELAEPND